MIAGEVAEVAELAEVVEVVEVVELAGAAEARLEASSDRRRRILDLRWIFVSLDLRSPRCKGRILKAPIFLRRRAEDWGVIDARNARNPEVPNSVPNVLH